MKRTVNEAGKAEPMSARDTAPSKRGARHVLSSSRAIAACSLALAGSLALGSCAAPAASDLATAPAGSRELLDAQEPSFEPPPAPEPEPADEPEPVRYAPHGEDLAALPGTKEPYAFAAADGDTAPQLGDDTIAELDAAVKELSGKGAEVGYLLFDLETGRGVAADIDARVFVASSIKAPYALFLCETRFDTGEARIDDELEGTTLGALVEAAVSESDNESYHLLRNRFDGPAFRAWLDDLGIGDEFSAELGTPYYTARESAVLWLRMNEYLQSDAPSAAWLEGLLENTTVSFMRHAIADDSVSVISKAGWLDGKDDYDGFCDSGIVTEDGHRYLLTVMTSLPYSADVEYAFEGVVSAVWNARGDIAA